MLSNLYRPFVNFTPTPGAFTPTAEAHATACVNHAMAQTLIMHQVLKDTDLMNGWQEFFLWQWNATVTLVGFVLAYPINPVTPKARKVIDKAVEIFEVYGSNFAIADSAIAVTKDLMQKADMLAGQLRMGIKAGANALSDAGRQVHEDRALDESSGMFPQAGESFNEFMDWAMAVDSFNDYDALFDMSDDTLDWLGQPV